jgi:AraC-like DNA-binding protein
VFAPPGEGAAAYLEFAPSAALADFVSCIGVCTERFAPGQVVEERVVPDGAVHLVFNLADAPRDAAGGGGLPVEAVGASCAAARLRMSGTLDGVSIGLRPGAVGALLGIPAAEIAGRTVSLDDAWGGLGAETLERLAAARGAPARVAVLEDALRRRLARAGIGTHRGAVHAMRLIAGSGGRMRVRDLAAAVGVGERRLEQVFHTHVGLSPKAACRLARFRASVRLLTDRPDVSWSYVAHACGFYDQAHLIHEYRSVAGLTPTEFRARLTSDSSKTEV